MYQGLRISPLRLACLKQNSLTRFLWGKHFPASITDRFQRFGLCCERLISLCIIILRTLSTRLKPYVRQGDFRCIQGQDLSCHGVNHETWNPMLIKTASKKRPQNVLQCISKPFTIKISTLIN